MSLFRILILFAYLFNSSGLLAQVLGPKAASSLNTQESADISPSQAGKIDLVSGEARIVQNGKQPRSAVVGDTVNEGDTLITGKNSELHVTMQDTGFIALRPNTSLKIDAYKADGDSLDKGVFKLFIGGMRSITGWIGKFNQNSYQVNTPTATVGIRGTDHETWYIPPGSSEGEPGTYDKVFIGETSIQTNNGQTKVDADQAGFVSSEAGKPPRVLGRVPGFFRPGPHEDIINKKHAEIQKMIEQRREERRKVISEKIASLHAALAQLKQQQIRNNASTVERKLAAEQLQRIDEETLGTLRTRVEAIQEKIKTLQEMRRSIQEKTAIDIWKNKELREQIKRVIEVGTVIREEYKQIQDDRKVLTDKDRELSEQRRVQADEQRLQNEGQFGELSKRQKTVQEKQRTIQEMREALTAANNSGGSNLNEQRKALREASESVTIEQKEIQDALYSLFEKNAAATEARMKAMEIQRQDTQRELAALSEKEDLLQERQKANQEKHEAIQESSALNPVKKRYVHNLLTSMREMATTVHNEFREIQDLRKALTAKNMAAADERLRMDREQLMAIRDKRRDVYEKNTDLQNEREAMLEEIRTLYDQEQKRYRDELRADRQLSDAINNLLSDTGQTPLF